MMEKSKKEKGLFNKLNDILMPIGQKLGTEPHLQAIASKK